VAYFFLRHHVELTKTIMSPENKRNNQNQSITTATLRLPGGAWGVWAPTWRRGAWAYRGGLPPIACYM